MKKHYEIRVKGIVQGVGFRPFIFHIAEKYGVLGSVINDTAGVLINAEGGDGDIDLFLDAIKSDAPPLAHITAIETKEGDIAGYTGFTIGESAPADERMAFYSPDVALCDECLSEFFDTRDRRCHYPFITCINCGPRFSIVRDIPYDRKNTTMDVFPLCPDCAGEYHDSRDRRFHTQPTACHVCGPHVTLRDRKGAVLSEDIDDMAEQTLAMFRQGRIGAIKGVGGYHLAVDALNYPAVAELRKRKNRPFKPFALMAAGIEVIERFLDVSSAEKNLLLSKERPIVILREKTAYVSRAVAPGMTCHGIMLPYTPFQHLLFSLDPDMVLVMTSGNLSDEPIVYRDDIALERLAPFADFFVTYNRDILSQCDDSVLFVEQERPLFIRRSRGYVPLPFASEESTAVILASGGDLKNSFAIARKDFVIMSQFLGDMADAATHQAFKDTVKHFIDVFDAKPEVIVSDLHPGYLTTQFADEMAGGTIRRIQVQHHHAHIASVMEDQNLDGTIMGIAFDGTGYGPDATLWGSEFLIADRGGYERAGHFSYFPLPGGENAIRDVWKIGLSLLYTAYGEKYPPVMKEPGSAAVVEIMKKNINSPLTCSIGRIFDGVSALLGISRSVSTEAEAAMLLEEAALRGAQDGDEFVIPFDDSSPIVIDTGALVRYVAEKLQAGDKVEDIAAAFHRAISVATVKVAEKLRERTGLNRLALSGGVFHNRILLRQIGAFLRDRGFEVFMPEKVPFNDGCIALGQVAVAKRVLL